MRRVTRAHPQSDDAGFTLVETLAAFTILIMVLSALLIAVAGGMRANARTAFTLTAIRLAQSHLAEVAISAPLVLGASDGRFENGYLWHQDVAAYPGAAGEHALYWVTLTVKNSTDQRAGDAFTMMTVKQVPARP